MCLRAKIWRSLQEMVSLVRLNRLIDLLIKLHSQICRHTYPPPFHLRANRAPFRFCAISPPNLSNLKCPRQAGCFSRCFEGCQKRKKCKIWSRNRRRQRNPDWSCMWTVRTDCQERFDFCRCPCRAFGKGKWSKGRWSRRSETKWWRTASKGRKQKTNPPESVCTRDSSCRLWTEPTDSCWAERAPCSLADRVLHSNRRAEELCRPDRWWLHQLIHRRSHCRVLR